MAAIPRYRPHAGPALFSAGFRPFFLAAALWAALGAGAAVALRLSRWRGARTIREPLALILHVGDGRLAVGPLFLGLTGLHAFLPSTTALRKAHQIARLNTARFRAFWGTGSRRARWRGP